MKSIRIFDMLTFRNINLFIYLFSKWCSQRIKKNITPKLHKDPPILCMKFKNDISYV